MRELVESVRGVVFESVARHNAAVERYIRDYLWANRTTRLDIELVMSELKIESNDGACFVRLQDSDAYQFVVRRDVGIRQRLPIRFRPNLPD